MAATPGFPSNLLTEPWTTRLAYFQRYTVAHPRLTEAKERLVAAIQNAEPNSLVLVFGPTGVGKTTLRIRTEQILTEQLRPELEADRSRIPVVSVEATAPESGSFCWRDHFKRLLTEMDEPLIERKRSPETSLARPKSTTPEYRHGVEQALRFRRPAAVMIDEAQHLAKMASGRRLLDQLDVLKSIANRTQTVHVLYGTYDLLAFRNLNGQLSRRSMDVHFPRYRLEAAGDRQIFIGVLRSFGQQLPLPETPDLAKDWEFLFERSVGCVGILKQWLARSLSAALRSGETTLKLQHLESQALSISQVDKILSETTEGEMRLTDTEEAISAFRLRLGLPVKEVGPTADGTGQITPVLPGTSMHAGRKPGQRRPMRDPIGLPEHLHAAQS